MAADKRPPPISLRLPAEMRAWVAEQARASRRSVNSQLIVLVEEVMRLKTPGPQESRQ